MLYLGTNNNNRLTHARHCADVTIIGKSYAHLAVLCPLEIHVDQNESEDNRRDLRVIRCEHEAVKENEGYRKGLRSSKGIMNAYYQLIN